MSVLYFQRFVRNNMNIDHCMYAKAIMEGKDMKRARLIYNPTAGREGVRRHLADILETLERAGYETSAHATITKGDATREAELATLRRYDLVIAAGGDGTVNEVVNGLAEKPYRPTLGVLPLGTSNDFANAIGVPKNIHKAIEILAQGTVKPVDIGRMNNRYFINIGGGGILTELSYEVPSKLKTVLGQFAYYVKGVEKLPGLRPVPVEVRANGKVWNEELMLFLVANSKIIGGFDKIAPYADLSDGLFDVILVKKSNIMELARLMTLVLRGEHLNDSKIIHFQTQHLSVRSPAEVSINIDGELGGTSPCDFRVLRNHLHVIVNQ